MSYDEPRYPHRPRQDPPPSTRRPGLRAVIWGSLSLFAVLFALLTFQLSASASPAVVNSKKNVVTVSKPAGSEFAESSATDVESPEPESEEVEGEESEAAELEAAEFEAAELEAAEIEAIEAEEQAPVVTSAS